MGEFCAETIPLSWQPTSCIPSHLECSNSFTRNSLIRLNNAYWAPHGDLGTHVCEYTFVRHPFRRFALAYKEVIMRERNAEKKVSPKHIAIQRTHWFPQEQDNTHAQARAFIRDVVEMKWIDAMDILETSGAQGVGDNPRHFDHIFSQRNILKGFQNVIRNILTKVVKEICPCICFAWVPSHVC